MVCPNTGLQEADCSCEECDDIRELAAMRRRRLEVTDPRMKASLDHWIAIYTEALVERDRMVA